VCARKWIIVGLLATPFPALAGKLADGLEGKPIARIRFDPPLQPIPDEELAQLLPFQPGDAVTGTGVREAIARLYATGRYQDILVDAQSLGETVELRFLTEPSWFVGRVTVEGVPAPPNRGQLINATGLELGQEFREEDLPKAVANLQELLRANGFFEAQVRPVVTRENSFYQVNITFLVEPGPRARYTMPRMEGVNEKRAEHLAHATGWERFWFLPGWRTVNERRTRRGLERIRQYLQKHDRLLSTVVLEALQYDPQARTALPVIRVKEGPRVRILVTGVKAGQGLLKRLIPVYQEQSLDPDLLVEGARNLAEYFQSRGFFDCEASFTQRQEKDLAIIEYQVRRGPRYKLVQVTIEGNRYFDEETLRERLAIRPASRLRYRHGRFSRWMLEEDLDAIRSLYRANGFREVKVVAETQAGVGGKPEHLAVHIRIEEGPQWKVASLELEGVSPENRQAVYERLASIEGQPFSEANLITDRDNVLAYYYNNGYPQASLDWEIQPAERPAEVKLRLRIREGDQQFVRAVVVTGLKNSDPDMVYNRILLRPGQPLSQSAIAETQRRLYELGVFARVNIAVQNPEGHERYRYVLHDLEEASRYSVNAGLGAQIARIGAGVTDFEAPTGTPGFSPRVSFGISRANMFGAGHTASLQGRLSNIRRRAMVNYLAPQFKGRENLSLTFTALYDFSRDINTFEGTRWEGSVQITQQISRALSWQHRFAYRRVTINEATLKIDPALIPVFAQAVRVGFLSTGLVRDRRDDPLESTRGSYTTFEVGLASKYLGSQTDYFRLVGRNSTYYRLGSGLVLARSLILGWLRNLAADPATNPIPLAERFFAGGASSHRGFPDNQAGPRDLETGFPIGGNAVVMHNLELRFPLLGDNLGGVIFQDAGNVYSDLGHFSFRFHQRNKRDFDYMVHAFGIGLRYRTPIGPIRLDFSYSPNAPRFFGFKGTREDLIGGRGEKTDRRIGPFQFFFSLGQTF